MKFADCSALARDGFLRKETILHNRKKIVFAHDDVPEFVNSVEKFCPVHSWPLNPSYILILTNIFF